MAIVTILLRDCILPMAFQATLIKSAASRQNPSKLGFVRDLHAFSPQTGGKSRFFAKDKVKVAGEACNSSHSARGEVGQ